MPDGYSNRFRLTGHSNSSSFQTMKRIFSTILSSSLGLFYLSGEHDEKGKLLNLKAYPIVDAIVFPALDFTKEDLPDTVAAIESALAGFLSSN